MTLWHSSELPQWQNEPRKMGEKTDFLGVNEEKMGSKKSDLANRHGDFHGIYFWDIIEIYNQLHHLKTFIPCPCSKASSGARLLGHYMADFQVQALEAA